MRLEKRIIIKKNKKSLPLKNIRKIIIDSNDVIRAFKRYDDLFEVKLIINE
ncbi:hypothetical protein [Deferribacter autotrophicus]|uniref:hypothetical protein n=1 Tax=Deferribacter autotrophicus TaxID=500465 RepID=UPI001CAA86FC|nr:hypothetical protein [Deferribacter autotrophicus]